MEVDLWLDESGNFKEDYKRNDRPSLVGGVMVESGKITEKQAEDLLVKAQQVVPSLKNEKTIHSTEISNKDYGLFAPAVLESLRDAGAQLVIFENEELMKIVNGDLTYIHILAEGIIQLFQTLSLKSNEKVKINVYAARRVDVDKSEEADYTIMIKEKQYRERLQEKLDLGYARRSIRPTDQKWEWEFKLGSARKDPRLMLADVVCHSWFRQDHRKFNEKQRETVISLYDERYLFTALERSTLKSIQRHFSQGTIGDALYEWLLMDDEWRELDGKEQVATMKERELLQDILRGLKQLTSTAREIQLDILLSHLKTFILLERNLTKGRAILIKIRDDIMDQMEKMDIKDDNFSFEINLMLFTNATHQGDLILSEEQVKLCRADLQSLARRWENYDILLEYYIREAVHIMNRYGFSEVIDRMNQVENLINNMIELLPIALQEELALETEQMNAEVLGKTLGTRLQAYVMLARKDKTYLEFAREDSDRAMLNFTSESDVHRQYQYRSMLECEANEFALSLQWLGKSINFTGEDPDQLLQTVLDDGFSRNIYFFMHYSRLMAEAKLSAADDFADKLYEAWNKLQLEEELEDNRKNQHPDEIIYWKLGSYLMLNGNVKAALEKYERAITICEEQVGSQTIRSIGVTIRAEQVALLFRQGKRFERERKQLLRKLRNEFDKFNQLELLPSMRIFFADWENLLALKEEEDATFYEKLFQLSRTVNY